jgi:hypothetical protein
MNLLDPDRKEASGRGRGRRRRWAVSPVLDEPRTSVLDVKKAESRRHYLARMTRSRTDSPVGRRPIIRSRRCGAARGGTSVQGTVCYACDAARRGKAIRPVIFPGLYCVSTARREREE